MLERVLNAKSVAVIGASKNETKRGFQAIKTLLDDKYEGEIFPVNPKEDSILGLKCYKDITEINKTVDLALITTPAKTIPSILKSCGKKEVAGAVIIAGGFSELGKEGKSLQEEMVTTAQEAGIRLIGPNTSGMINTKTNLNLAGIPNVPKGDIALLCQSGNMALTLITEAIIKKHEGFTYYVGVGNESDIKFHEYLEFLADDNDTKAILMYVEGMSEGRKFLQLANKTCTKKPIILLKSGRSSVGKKSAGSHTGSLAGMSAVANPAFKRSGIIVIDNSDELFPVAETLANQPPVKNNKIAILTDGGGHGTIAADLLTDYKIELPELSEKTKNKLRKILPLAASLVNPVDIAGGADSDPSVFADCADIILKDPNVGGLLIVGLFGGYGIRFAKSLAMPEEEAAHRLGKLIKKQKKPIVIHSLYSSYDSHSFEILRYFNIPFNGSLDIACKCIASLCQYGEYLNSYHLKTNFIFNWGKKAKKQGQKIIANAKAEGRRSLLENEAKQLLKLHYNGDDPLLRDKIATCSDQAVKFAKELKQNVVLKIVSPDILHKSDAGGVLVDLKTKADIKAGYRKIIANAKKFNPKADIRGVLVCPMVKKDIEVIIGTKIDDQFGPVIMYGLGGIMVEVIKDVTFRVLPISPAFAKYMINDIRSAVILDGIRGQAGYDKKALRRLLLSCSELIEAYPEIEEMDLNPVILHHTGLSVVDARIILKE